MRTLGRRMHAKARPEFSLSARPVQRLEAMNLGETVPLSKAEAQYFQCRDVHGRVLDGVYAAPVASAGDTLAVGNRMLTLSTRSLGSHALARAGGAVADPCDADLRASCTRGGGSHGRLRGQPAPSALCFEDEVSAWHRPRVLAARLAFEEADRSYRKGRNPGEGARCPDLVPSVI